MYPHDSHIVIASQWLQRIRNADGGWGLFEEAPSRIVNTAEAVLGLLCAGASRPDLEPSIDLLRRVVLAQTSDRSGLDCKFTRHFEWVSLALLEYGLDGADEAVKASLEWLEGARNEDGGWGHDKGLPSATYPTSLAVRVLVKAGRRHEADRPVLWLMQAQHITADGGWGFTHEEASNPGCTAYALLALTEYFQVSEDTKEIAIAKDYLLEYPETDGWGLDAESGVASDLTYHFHHFSTPWALLALLQARANIDHPKMWSGLSYLLALQSETGGWAELPGQRPTVYATFNAVCALSSLFARFHAAVDLIPLLDEKMRTTAELQTLQRRLDEQIQQSSQLQARESTAFTVGGQSIWFSISYALFGWTLIPAALAYAAFVLVFIAACGDTPLEVGLPFLGLPLFVAGVFLHFRRVMKWSIEATVAITVGLLALLVAVAFGAPALLR